MSVRPLVGPSISIATVVSDDPPPLQEKKFDPPKKKKGGGAKIVFFLFFRLTMVFRTKNIFRHFDPPTVKSQETLTSLAPSRSREIEFSFLFLFSILIQDFEEKFSFSSRFMRI